MKSKLSNEGYILFNHEDSPGLEPAMVQTIGDDLPFTAGHGVFEAPTYTCSHCQFLVVLNPLRQRERGWCSKCDRYICDVCAAAKQAGADCVPFDKIVEVIQETAERNQDVTGIVEQLTNREPLKK